MIQMNPWSMASLILLAVWAGSNIGHLLTIWQIEAKKGGKPMGEERNDGVLYAGIDMDTEEESKRMTREALLDDLFPTRRTPKEEAELARATYEKMLSYAIAGCRNLLWKTAFDLNKPELSATQAQEIVYNLGQMANDLDSYEAEAERLGLGK